MNVLKNDGGLLPLKQMNQRIARVSIGPNSYAFKEGIERFSKMEEIASQRGSSLLDMNLEEMDALWNLVKKKN